MEIHELVELVKPKTQGCARLCCQVSRCSFPRKLGKSPVHQTFLVLLAVRMMREFTFWFEHIWAPTDPVVEAVPVSLWLSGPRQSDTQACIYHQRVAVHGIWPMKYPQKQVCEPTTNITWENSKLCRSLQAICKYGCYMLLSTPSCGGCHGRLVECKAWPRQNPATRPAFPVPCLRPFVQLPKQFKGVLPGISWNSMQNIAKQ